MALYLEGRSGMSPLHARHIEFDGGGRPRFSPDVVAWVAGSTQPQTELAALGGSSDTWGLSALDRDATHFGLARIAITNPPKLSEVITWREYPNGLQPAPVATGKVCGNPVIAYVRPMTAEPHAPQELHLANLDKDGLGASTVLARGKAFSSVSLVGIPGGALVTWVADRRTWAVTLHCR